MMRRRTIILTALFAVAGLSGPAAPASAGDFRPVQHLAGSARAGVARIDPRLSGQFVNLNVVGASSVNVSTVGLEGHNAHNVARASTGNIESRTTYNALGMGVEQKAAASDNPTHAEAVHPSGALVRAHARRVDPAGGTCPPAAADGVRVLSQSQVALGAAFGVGGIEIDPLGRSASTVSLVPVPGEQGLAVHSVASTEVASVRLFGTLDLEILQAPRLQARATGLAGGASVSYTAPVIRVVDVATGEPIATLDATEHRFDLTPDNATIRGVPAWVMLRAGAAHDVIAMADGTYARAQADLVQLRFPEGFEWMNLRVAPLAAMASAPTGGVTTCDGGAAPVVDRTVPRILVFERAGGWEHTSLTQANDALAEIANLTGAFTLEFADDLSFLRPDKLARIDAIYFNSTTGEFLTTAAQRDLMTKWALCNGGVVGSHAASDANHTWPVWKELIGARFASHPHTGYFPLIGDATVLVEDQVSPITEAWHGMSSFRWAEEYYMFTDDPRGQQDIKVLLSLDESTVYPQSTLLPAPFKGGYGHHQPLVWTKTFRGKGRVFYTAFGHNGFSWRYAEMRHHVLRGIEWVTAQRPDRDCLAP